MKREKRAPKRKSAPPLHAQIDNTNSAIERPAGASANQCLVVGIGASAGGIEAFSALLRQIPQDTQLAFVLIAHLDPHHESMLPELLANQTRIPVVQVHHEMAVECNHVYVIPPNQEMVITRGVLKLRPRAEGRTRYLPIDTFLQSLAEDQRAKAIGVVLSGNASDGTLGLKAIKGEGGITFAQDGSAKFDSMPRTAIAAGVVDFILPPEGIARELASLARHPYLAPADPATILPEEGPLSKILESLRQATGVDFSQYKQTTIQRRTMRRMALKKIDSPEVYEEYLKQHPDELQGLYNDLLINVTEFFRDPGTFEALHQVAFPKIVKDRPEGDPIRIWVPACSTGEEVYSLAISLIEFLENARQRYEIQLFGTDVSEYAIGKARTGIYPKTLAATVSSERLRRFFVQADSGYQIGRHIRDSCVFSLQNIIKDPPLSRMDLVSCRNLLIYLRPAMQVRVAAVLHYALKTTGCLLLGNSETLGSMGIYFSALDRQHKIYCRNMAAGDPPLEVPSRLTLHGSHTSHTAQPAAATPAPEPLEAVQRYVDRHLMDHAPRAIVVNENFRITTIRGNVQVFLGVPAETGIPLLDALKEDLAEPLRIVLSESRTEDMPAQRQALRFHIDGEIRLVDIQILPVSIPQQPVHYLVIFENLRAPAPPASDGTTRSGEADAQTIRQLEQRLVSGRQYLQTVIEELRSANEEVQSANEELQSTNEELQTAKEELQASNEELRTINDEMQNRNSELSQAHNDLANLLSSMNVPVLMLDNELRIRRFTPISEKILHLIASDVGRPIADLKVRINVPDIEQILRNVIATPTVYEREVQDEEGRWYAMRVRPYRTTENRIEGAVLQLVDIDEIKRGVERLRRARDYAEAIVNTVREPLVALHRGQRIQTANASFYQTFRLTPEDAADRTIYEIAHGKLDCPELHGLLDRAAEQDDEMQEVEIECDLRDRGLRNIVVNARSIHQDDGHGLTLLAFEDITERKQEAEARYRRLFEAAKDGILIADAETGEINDVNPFVEQLSGFPRQELIGKKLWEIEALGDIPDLQSAVERIRVEGTVRFPDVPIRTKDGRLVQAEVVANIYTEKKGRVIQFNIRDISERRKFFRQIQESQKLESLGLLAGGIAHDFNNLLTGIVGNASLALAESRPGELMRTYLRDVIRAGEQAAHLTRQMLAYAGKGRLVVQPVDVSSLIRETHPLIQSSIPKMVNLRFDLLENPPLVSGDPTQIQQLLMNLIINAGESIPEGMGGTVSVRTALRQITREDIADSFEDDDLEPGQYLLIEVTDTGVGMDEATKARIFDPFFTTKFTGRGLGLAAVRGLVKSHRGALHVFSTPGRGTTFTVLLPITAGQRPSTPEAPGTKEARTGHGTILVVDDDATVRQVAERGLSRNGYAVLLAKNGEEAVKLLRDHRDEVSLIVLDLTMPVMSGEQAFTELKSIRSDVPVIVSSGYDEAEAVRRFGGREFAGFLQKPYTAQRLLERVRNVLA